MTAEHEELASALETLARELEAEHWKGAALGWASDQETVEESASTIRQLSRDLEEARGDTARLDWLETQRNRIGGIGMLKGTNAWGISGAADTLREAIDHALSPQTEDAET